MNLNTNNHHHHSNTNKKKKKNLTPEVEFRLNLDHCSKTKDLSTAISLFNSATSTSSTTTIRLNQHHFNSFLYICSNAVTDTSSTIRHSAIDFGFKVYNHLVSCSITPNEATATAVSRLAAAKGDGDMALELAKGVGNAAKLRTYGPALLCYCKNGEADKAYEVVSHMSCIGLQLEETELAALLKVSVEKGRAEKVYEFLHKLRSTVRGVSDSTAEIIETWFAGEKVTEVGMENRDEDQVKEAIQRNGGGWHGFGWLGKGRWHVQRSNITPDGRCLTCMEQLVCVDTDTVETEKFAQSVASLAMEREAEAHFKEFQDWLEQHSEYEALVDGANVGLYQQNFAEGGFSITQLDAVVRELYNRSKKWPLVILHNKRVRSLFENAANRELLEMWMKERALYATPYGSNDDWYWLYAAVKLKCLLVTNDEIRDHIFELLGSSFFSTWKERHQVKYTFLKGNLKLIMPPSYSLVIQESGNGSWHVPVGGESSDETLRSWLCITRPESFESNANVQQTCNNECSASSSNFSQTSVSVPPSKNCKRKDRSLSPAPSGLDS